MVARYAAASAATPAAPAFLRQPAFGHLIERQRADSVDRLDQPLGELLLGRYVFVGHEVAHPLIEDERLVDGLEMMIPHGACRCGKGKHVVDRRGDLEGALVAVAHDAFDPFGIDDTGAHHAANLFLQAADHRLFRPGMVVVVDAGTFAGDMLDGRAAQHRAQARAASRYLSGSVVYSAWP